MDRALALIIGIVIGWADCYFYFETQTEPAPVEQTDG